MSPALLLHGRRIGRGAIAGMLVFQTGCATVARSGPTAGYDCVSVENETSDAVMVYLDVGTYVVELGRVGPESRRDLPFRRIDLPENFTHAYLRIVPAPPAHAWPPSPPPLSELIRTADVNHTSWRYTGRDLTPRGTPGTAESPAAAASDRRCSSFQPSR